MLGGRNKETSEIEEILGRVKREATLSLEANRAVVQLMDKATELEKQLKARDADLVNAEKKVNEYRTMALNSERETKVLREKLKLAEEQAAKNAQAVHDAAREAAVAGAYKDCLKTIFAPYRMREQVMGSANQNQYDAAGRSMTVGGAIQKTIEQSEVSFDGSVR